MIKPPRTLFVLGGVVVLGVGFVAALMVSGPRSYSHHSKIGAIENLLRMIDGSVSQWAIETHQTAGAFPSQKDIAPYLSPSLFDRNGSLKSVAGERYVLRPLPQSPEAVLTREVEGRAKGTVFYCGTNGDVEIQVRPPKENAVPNPDQNPM
jgi:hypothetical protein